MPSMSRAALNEGVRSAAPPPPRPSDRRAVACSSQLDPTHLVNAAKVDARISSQISSLMRERAEGGASLNSLLGRCPRLPSQRPPPAFIAQQHH